MPRINENRMKVCRPQKVESNMEIDQKIIDAIGSFRLDSNIHRIKLEVEFTDGSGISHELIKPNKIDNGK